MSDLDVLADESLAELGCVSCGRLICSMGFTHDRKDTAVCGSTGLSTLCPEGLAREDIGTWWLAGQAEKVQHVRLATLRGLKCTTASELAEVAIVAAVVASIVASVVSSVVTTIVASVGWVAVRWGVGNSSWLSSTLGDQWAGSGHGGECESEELHVD